MPKDNKLKLDLKLDLNWIKPFVATFFEVAAYAVAVVILLELKVSHQRKVV